ncbi:MAG: hypothetical protein VSS75_028700 [Candidatus Parabeggiatoa sp.]|nr:hypothetical protein [Candidatus Parabeggiatoa sp.]
MNTFFEPVYLNERMVLNSAAYFFRGVSLESENTEEKTSANKGNVSLGFKEILNHLLPISLSAEQNKTTKVVEKTARHYTLGSLHMAVIDQLGKDIVKLNPEAHDSLQEVQGNYVDIEVILKPIDFFTILEIVKTFFPFVVKLAETFREIEQKNNPPSKQKNKGIENKPGGFKAVAYKIKDFKEIGETTLKQLEDDYMKANLLEMVMVSPNDPNHQLGIVDLDVTDYDPSEIKARLNDGKFHVIGKVSKFVNDGESLSLVQRTSLSTLIDILTKLVQLNEEQQEVQKVLNSIDIVKPMLEKVVQLQIPGPAYRIMAMSVCI